MRSSSRAFYSWKARRVIRFPFDVPPAMPTPIIPCKCEGTAGCAAHVRDRPGEDDPEASISARSPSGGGEVRLWVSEIRRVPQFAQAQDALLAFARQVSDGRIRESGR